MNELVVIDFLSSLDSIPFLDKSWLNLEQKQLIFLDIHGQVSNKLIFIEQLRGEHLGQVSNHNRERNLELSIDFCSEKFLQMGIPHFGTGQVPDSRIQQLNYRSSTLTD